MDKCCKTYSIYKDEDSVSRRFAKVQGTGVLQLDEKMLVVSKSPFRVPRRKYENYAGSTAANTIGRVVMDGPSGVWQGYWATKKQMYGDSNLIPTGGPAPQSDELDATTEPRSKNPVEPMFYHSLPESFYLEILLAFPIGAVIDLTPGEGCLARAAYQLGVRYTGVTFNEAHAAGLRGRLEGCVISDMLLEGHRLYDATFHAALRGGGVDGSGKRNNAGKDPNRRPKKKPRKKNNKGDQGGGQGGESGGKGGEGGGEGGEGGEGDSEDGEDDFSNDEGGEAWRLSRHRGG